MIALLFDRFKELAGWSLWEVGFLYGMIGICFAVAEMIGRGVDTFQRSVVRGDFDTMLIRPLSTFFQVFAHEFLLRRIRAVGAGAGCLAYCQFAISYTVVVYQGGISIDFTHQWDLLFYRSFRDWCNELFLDCPIN